MGLGTSYMSRALLYYEQLFLFLFSPNLTFEEVIQMDSSFAAPVRCYL